MRYTGPKKKLCRREGKNLFGSEKYALTDSKRKLLGKNVGRMNLYGQQLRAKQATKRMFGVSEKQFANYFKKASRMKVSSFVLNRQQNVCLVFLKNNSPTILKKHLV